jgi:folylpolyglutamate synthase/dihydropteroate synthase
MHALLAALGSPHERLSVVHIAGTKGKGSVAVLLSSVLRAAGYRVGTYTSPHLFDIRERVVVGGGGAPGQQAQPDSSSSCAAGEPVSEQQWEALAVQAAAAVDAMTAPQQQQQQAQPPSHFEAVTAMALQHFVNEGVQLAVIETGLGGATDATNVWGPDQLQAAVLTAVGLDHVDALGGSLEAIAAAKAGIMKPGVPVVVGPQQAPAASGPAAAGTAGAAATPSVHGQVQRAADSAAVMSVFRDAARRPGMACPLLLAADVVQVRSSAADGSTDDGSSSSVTLLPGPGPHLARQSLSLTATLDAAAVLHSSAAAAASTPLQLHLPGVALQLVGAHQAGNVATAVAAALLLAARGWRCIDAAAVQRGLEAAWLPGRFQVRVSACGV